MGIADLIKCPFCGRLVPDNIIRNCEVCGEEICFICAMEYKGNYNLCATCKIFKRAHDAGK